MDHEFGYVVRVVTFAGSDYWLGQRVYRTYDSALTVKHNLQDAQFGRYARVYVRPATAQQVQDALSVVD